MQRAGPCALDAIAIRLNKRQATVFLALLTIGPVTAFTYLAIARLIAHRKAKPMTNQEQKDLAIRIARKAERNRRNNPWSEPAVMERYMTDAEILHAAGFRTKGQPETPRERIRRRLLAH